MGERADKFLGQVEMKKPRAKRDREV